MTAPSSPPPPPSPKPPSAPAQPSPASMSQNLQKPQNRRMWLVILAALAVSLVSLVVALTSLAGARVARDEAADAERLAEALSGAGAGGPTPAVSDPAVAPTTAEPLPTDSPQGTEAPAQSLNPQAAFTPRYSSEVLNPQVTSIYDAYLDLDEPRVVLNHSEADLVMESGGRVDPPYFDLEESDVTAALAGSPEASPEDCLERIRTSPLPPDAEVPTQRGTVLCLRTSLSRAADQGISQKLVVLHVTALGDEGRVTVEVNAWDQPR